MKKKIKIIKKEENQKIEEVFSEGSNLLVFKEEQPDTIGKSGSKPTWGYVYINKNGSTILKGIALHKEFEYDYPKAAYAEKIWSIIGKELLEDEVRVADIDVVEGKYGYPETLSYRLMVNEIEDMTHFSDIFYSIFERDEIRSKKNIFSIDDILKCIKSQVKDEENFKRIKKSIIKVLVLDAVTNNSDRHGLNWALVRDERTNKYELAVFDHSPAFVDMIEYQPNSTSGLWTSSHTTVGKDVGRTTMGSMGGDIVQYISEKYPEYFSEFTDKFEQKLPTILEKIKKENMDIEFSRLTIKLQQKRSFLKKLKQRGEMEYE